MPPKQSASVRQPIGVFFATSHMPIRTHECGFGPAWSTQQTSEDEQIVWLSRHGSVRMLPPLPVADVELIALDVASVPLEIDEDAPPEPVPTVVAAVVVVDEAPPPPADVEPPAELVAGIPGSRPMIALHATAPTAAANAM